MHSDIQRPHLGGRPRLFEALALVWFTAIALVASMAPREAVAQEGTDLCLMCHEQESLFAGKEDPERYVVTRQGHERSMHGQAGVTCTDCHRGLTFPHPDDPPKADCSICHDDQSVQHGISLHGQAAARGDTLAPGCSDCRKGQDDL